MILALILVPTIAGILAFALRNTALRRGLLVLTAVVHAALTVSSWLYPPAPCLYGWLGLDAPGLLFLSIASALFLAASFYAVGYLGREHEVKTDFEDRTVFSNAPEAVFIGCLLLFMATVTLTCVSQHLGILWVAVEATTLASAPLIYFHRHHRSLEATWKYLLICSVAIGLALLGNFFLVASSLNSSSEVPMVLGDLLKQAPELQAPWLKVAFVLVLVGYGTKMGLAPMHSWLPDAHSESPSVVSAMLSGALLNCAFLGVLRFYQVLVAAGLAEYGQSLLLVLGLTSMAFAGVFILGQTDYKRMLAYSSVENMGILALGVGLGGPAATFGAMLHAVNHSVTKAMLFLVAGNILTAYKTKVTGDVQGVLRVLPISGVLWVVGFLAITGTPPFGPFMSEFTLLKAALDQGRTGVAVLYLALLALIFAGMAGVVLRMAQGLPGGARARLSEPASAVVPPMILGVGVLMLGLYIPPPLLEALHKAARALGGG